MSNKVFNTRIQNKHGTEADWAQATNFTPLLGELIVYDADENYSVQHIKIGDGVSNVNALPFVNTPVLKGKDNGIPTGLQNLVIQELSSKEIYEDLKAAGNLDENTIYLTPDDGTGSGIIIQNEEPVDAADGTLWLDLDAELNNAGDATPILKVKQNNRWVNVGSVSGGITVDTTVAQEALEKANAAMPKANFSWDSSTATLNITL